MKKLVVIILLIVTCLLLVSCGEKVSYHDATSSANIPYMFMVAVRGGKTL